MVESGSMEPAVMTGSLVFVKQQASYTAGDIITFGKANSVPTTHRIIRKNTNETFTTKGDANDSDDQNEVVQNEIIGKVFLTVPHVGYIIDFAKQPVGFTILIILPAVLLIIEELSVIWDEIKKIRNRRKAENNE